MSDRPREWQCVRNNIRWVAQSRCTSGFRLLHEKQLQWPKLSSVVFTITCVCGCECVRDIVDIDGKLRRYALKDCTYICIYKCMYICTKHGNDSWFICIYACMYVFLV